MQSWHTAMAMSAAACLLAAVPLAAQSAPPRYPSSSPVRPQTLPQAPLLEARPLARPQAAYAVQPASAQSTSIAAAPVAPLRLAPRGAAGQKPLNRPAANSPGGAIGTAVGGLAIVLGLFVVLVWCTKRFAPAGAAVLPKEAIELLGRTPLSPRQQMQLVRVGNKLLVVAVSATEVETLTEIVDPAEVERLAALCRKTQPTSATSSFSQVLGRLTSEPARGGFVGDAPRSRGSS
jgi:flagellar biosynthetic protein FliO